MDSFIKQIQLVCLTGLTLLFLHGSTTAQHHLVMTVQLEVEQGDLSGVSVKITKDGKAAFTQSGASAMQFRIELNRNYTFTFAKEGYITRTILFDSHVPPQRISQGFPPFPTGVRLFPESKNTPAHISASVEVISFDLKTKEFRIKDPDKNSDPVAGYGIQRNKGEKSPDPNRLSFRRHPGMEEPGAFSPMGEEVKITREDTHEQRKIVTRIRVIRNGVSAEYQRVSHDWGGVFYFKNGTTSISENLFMQWTGMRL